jgi:hypothetical protein
LHNLHPVFNVVVNVETLVPTRDVLVPIPAALSFWIAALARSVILFRLSMSVPSTSERTIEIFFGGIEWNRRLLPWSLQHVGRYLDVDDGICGRFDQHFNVADLKEQIVCGKW